MNEELSSEEKGMMQAMRDADNMPEPEVIEAPEPSSEPDPVVESRKEEPVVEVEPKEAKTQRLVPLSELQEERRERRAAQERLDAIMAKLTAEPPEPIKKAADPDQDPIGALKDVSEEVKELRRYRESQEAHNRQTQAVNNVMQQAIRQEAEYIKEKPDYNEAGNFLRQQRHNQLVSLGYDDQSARQTIINESLGLANMALQQGRRVPEVIYDLAVKSGFQRKAAIAQAESQDAKLDRIASGQRANVSLSNANGVQQKTGDLNAKAILAMDDDKFADFLGKLNKADRQAVLGQ